MMGLVSAWAARRSGSAEVSDERRLLLQAKRGDRAAFDRLVSVHQRELLSFLGARVAPEDLDDLMQETWVSAWTSLGSFDGRSRFKTWLFSIALHKRSSLYRRNNPLVDLESAMLEAAPAIDGAFESAELQHAIESALLALPESQREVVELYYFSGFTLPEIGRILNRNLNTVKYQFYRAHAEAADRLRGLNESSFTGVHLR